ncbi:MULTISPECIES: hypothetical protein [unclassified Arthrobacter]|uniref:hypothetical protein n=1 Tax=unclassified Arthrobacter TaxID=235627 RepID=UPI0033916DC1
MRSLPRWARTAVVVYLSVTAAVVLAVLLTGALEVGPDAGFRDGLRLALVVLTLPVSAAYFVLGTFSSARPPSPGEFSLGGLSPTVALYFLGFLLLSVVNAAAFRSVVLGARKRHTGVQLRGVTPDVRNLLWTVPLAIVLGLPQWLVASFAWCGISGCSGGGFGVATGSEWLAITLSVVNGFILAVALFGVRWLYPTGKRAAVAVAAGTLFGLLGAAVTHG